MQEQSDSTLSYQKPLKDPQRKGLTRLSLVDHRRYHPVQFLILSLVRILFHRSKVQYQYQPILNFNASAVVSTTISSIVFFHVPRIRLLLVFDVIAKFMVICLKNLGLK